MPDFPIAPNSMYESNVFDIPVKCIIYVEFVTTSTFFYAYEIHWNLKHLIKCKTISAHIISFIRYTV